MPKVVVTVGADGLPKIDAQGFHGVGCKAATEPFERKFAGAKMDTTEKPEMAMIEQAEEQKESMYL